MRRKRVKGYWVKKIERFYDCAKAKTRAGFLRNDENVPHVQAEKFKIEYVVSYSVTKGYLEELERIGITL